MTLFIRATTIVFLATSLAACNQAPATNPNVELAKAWVTAASTSRTAAMEMIETNMAEDGLLYRDRYVGFGFMWDNSQGAEEGRMVVTNVIADSPVAGVLQEGDEFISVGGVEVNANTMWNLPFRGQPGESVSAVVSRDGEEMPIEVSRGVISSTTTKAQMLEWMATLEDDDWGPDKWEITRPWGRVTWFTCGLRRGIPMRRRACHLRRIR